MGSIDGLRKQSDCYDKILKKAKVLANGAPIFLNGDHNERTVLISEYDIDGSDQEFHNKLHAGELILRQKIARTQDPVLRPFFGGEDGLSALAPALNGGSVKPYNSIHELRKVMLRA